MKKIILLFIIFLLNGCAITQLGQMIPGKMYSVESDETLDFGIEIVLTSAESGKLRVEDNGVVYSGYYSVLYPRKNSEGYNAIGRILVGRKEYSIHLIITPSSLFLGTPSGVGVAKEEKKTKYEIVFPVYE